MYVCNCNGVSRSEVDEAIAAGAQAPGVGIRCYQRQGEEDCCEGRRQREAGEPRIVGFGHVGVAVKDREGMPGNGGSAVVVQVPGDAES